MVKGALAVRHVAFEDLGSFERVLGDRGYRVAYAEAALDDLGALDPLAPDLLVVLGGPIGAYEEAGYPFVLDELRLLETRLAADLPTLGVCLGSQLMARALALQFRWFVGHACEIGATPGVSVADLRRDTARFAPALERQGRRFFEAWLDEVGL